MKTLVMYYSYSGSTKALAQQTAQTENADIYEIKDLHRPGKFRIFTEGAFRAMRMRIWPIQPLKIELSAYDNFILMCPIWAGHPAPQINSVLNFLPAGSQVSFVLVSGSGTNKCEDKLKKWAEGKKLTLKSIQTVKSSKETT